MPSPSPWPTTVHLTPTAHAALRAAATADLERVALLGGRRAPDALCVATIHPLPATADRTTFHVAPADFAAAEAELRAAGHTCLGFFHSHPSSPPAPSPTDHQQLWPDCLHLLGGPTGELRAYWFRGPAAIRLHLTIATDPAPCP